MCQVRDSNQGPVPTYSTYLEELSINLTPSQHKELSRIFFPIQECNCGIRSVQGKMRSTVWTVQCCVEVELIGFNLTLSLSMGTVPFALFSFTLIWYGIVLRHVVQYFVKIYGFAICGLIVKICGFEIFGLAHQNFFADLR